VDQMAKLAEADFRLGDYEASRAEAERLRNRQQRNAWAAWWLAHSYDALAYACFEKLASINPNSARVHEILAQTDAEHYQWNRAEKEYEEAIRLEPTLPDLHLGLGTAYWQAGQWTEAERELKTTLELNPASAVANYELGDALVEQHQWQAAIPCLQKAIQDEAVAYRARLDLAQAEEETGDARLAIEDLLPVAAQDRVGVLHYRLAILYRKVGEITQAQTALAQSQHLRQDSAQKAQLDVQQAEEEIRGVQPGSQSSHL
jgi:tetratricopeptide (TPR) repeat protein